MKRFEVAIWLIIYGMVKCAFVYYSKWPVYAYFEAGTAIGVGIILALIGIFERRE